MSIICGALKWLNDHNVRSKAVLVESIARMEEELRKIELDSSDDWLSAQSSRGSISREKNTLQMLLKKLTDSEEEINAIRKKYQVHITCFVHSQISAIEFTV